MVAKSQRLLVVDDEMPIRRILVKALEWQGFTPSEAADGLSAAETIRLSTQPFDLLITDMVMPGMNGAELVELTEKLSPDTAILVISGYAPSSSILGRCPFLQKPFGLDLFITTVEQVLRRKSPFPPRQALRSLQR